MRSSGSLLSSSPSASGPRWLIPSRRRPTARQKTLPQTCPDRSSPPSSTYLRFWRQSSFHWGVTGIGAALLLMRSSDFLVRFFPTLTRISAWNTTHVLPDGLRKRMVAYAWQSVAIMLLALIVWERCEVLLLKSLCADIRQVAFYSIAFSLGNYLLLSSTIFGAAASTTVFAQYGRDKSRMPQLAAASFRYLVLTSIPLHFIAVALAVPALLLCYGTRYAGAAMVVTVAPLLCMPKAFLAPIQSLLQSAERQTM